MPNLNFPFKGHELTADVEDNPDEPELATHEHTAKGMDMDEEKRSAYAALQAGNVRLEIISVIVTDTGEVVEITPAVRGAVTKAFHEYERACAKRYGSTKAKGSCRKK